VVEHIISYTPESSSLNRYDYQYLRLQGMAFCESNWHQGEKLSGLLLCFLERKAEEYGIENVDLPDCMGAVMFQVSLGFDLFKAALERYQEAFLGEMK
jgi:hypothetical protein